ncbi:DUF4288 domain-containing protein [Flavihumibacter rivuli]|uniref:DUF4288 domain-containing protein n=1 Tax=Flavihumibacter rivuli TaxID=2838156 RepID=UPI001BDEF487|nr:DUF4288 domain-containing protein [Flavihumibacter rivuli]ULQ54926.1 DUF4288 domain-containing protein [Flavihumibacter rivuli]
MEWFIAKLVYQIICGDGDHTPQFDEQMRLVQANAYAEAYEKACRLGKQEATSFTNDRSQLVQWQFVDVPELIHIDNFMDGAEICSRIHEEASGAHYRDAIVQKAMMVSKRTPLPFLP